MRILVTGGAGFIGSHVVEGYLRDGHRVSVIDNLATGFRSNVPPKARFYEADIRNTTRLREIFRREKPEVVNHHAAIAEVVRSLRDPLPTLEVNVSGTAGLLLASGEIGIKKFLFASTGGAIYGEPKRIPAAESQPPTPLSPYGLSKWLGEECIRFYSRIYGFPYLIFRYPNVYGPRQNPKGEAGVVAIFAGQMRDGERPTIFGNGSKARDYVYVEDLVRANRIGLRRGKNETLNLGWGRKVSDQDIFDTLARLLPYFDKAAYAPTRKGEVYQIALSARRAARILGWKPTVRLEEGIRRYLESTYRSTLRPSGRRLAQ
ncbi:MAG TPA: NAD-dependent epimerase/dehydratase family protein [Candidatus Polarisedimenticolia bacterium]|nr:NAD-dependent epimerase/dehydratase family protein [Candidatus Polarisedimenticolia bacterium]